MPRRSNLALPPTAETGQRLARLRRERGFTHLELAEKTGLEQTLVSDDERGRLGRNAEMLHRFATAPEVSAQRPITTVRGFQAAARA